MKVIPFILLSFSYLFGFELVLNAGREANEPFSVLHAKNDEPFICAQKESDNKPYFECEINGMVTNTLKDQSFALFDLRFLKEPQKIKMLILPKSAAKMFDLSQDIYKDKELEASSSHQSKGFTFIFSSQLGREDEGDGLNFNVIFPHETLPFVGALDLNSDPVIIPQSADINTYLRIKREYEKHNYPQVVTDAQNAITRYKGSIFMSEFILYKLRAQNEIHTADPSIRDQKILENMIDELKHYTRTFTSDRNYAEVLYMMLRTYIALSQRADVDYTMSILNNEFVRNDFTQLARLEYADYIYHLNEKEAAVLIYEDIYFNTKDLNLASRAALSLAKDELLNENPSEAVEFVNTVLRANGDYFGEDITKALELAKLFDKHHDVHTSSQIYERAFLKMPKIDERYEETLKNVALTLAQDGKAQQAKKYIDLYLNEFHDGNYLDALKKANDEVFFYVGENNATLLHERYQSLMKDYKDTDEKLANRALEEDVKLYFKEQNFPAILAYKAQIEEGKIPAALKLLEQSATLALKEELKADECIKAVKTFNEFSAYAIGQKIEDKKQMLSCLQRTSHNQQALEYIDKNMPEDEIFYSLKKAEILLENRQYPKVISLSKHIIASKILKEEAENFRAYYLQFIALLRQGEYNEAIKILQILEGFPMNFTMVEAYDALVSYAQDHKMTTSILNYAPKAIDYQNFKGINLFSPNLEFIYLEALQNTAQHEKGLELLRDLLKLKQLSTGDRARALYAQSQIYESLKDTQAQRKSLEECLKLGENSTWQDLCREKNALLSQ